MKTKILPTIKLCIFLWVGLVYMFFIKKSIFDVNQMTLMPLMPLKACRRFSILDGSFKIGMHIFR